MNPNSPQNMKRYSSCWMNELWILLHILRRSVRWAILLLAILALLFFVLIEFQRILSIQNLSTEKQIYKRIKSFEVFPFIFPHAAEPLLSSSCEAQQVLRSSQQVQENIFRKPPRNPQMEASVQCSERPYLLILVLSAPKNFEQRNAIRKSWADPKRWAIPPMSELESKTVFLVGKSSNISLEVLLKNESHKSKDILFGEYLDSYRNLTLKVMHGFSWALKHCHPIFLLKTDDDSFVNAPLLVQFLRKLNPVPSNLYVGRVHWTSLVIRNPKHRWYVSSFDYPNPRYGPYVDGAGYVLSQDVLKKLVLASNRVHIFPNEDAYVGTVLNASGVRPTYSARFRTYSNTWEVCKYLYLFVVHRVKASMQSEQQDIANKALDSCSMEHMVKGWV